MVRFAIINGDATLHNIRAKIYDPATVCGVCASKPFTAASCAAA